MRIRLLLLSALLLLAGCDWFEDPSPTSAQLIISGETGKSIRLIVSTEFLSSINESGQTRVSMITSDTLTVTLPYQADYSIERNQRFFVEAARVDADVQNIQMQVYIDDRRLFDDTGSLITGGRPLRFVYTFNQPVSREIVII